MYKVVLFDLDGTLLDTSLGIKKSVEYTIKEMKFPSLKEGELETFIGPPIYQSLQTKFKLTDQTAKQATEVFRNAYKGKFLYEANVYPGLFELLEMLRDKGIKIGVATYKREDYAKELLEHFGIAKLCDSIVGADFDNQLSKTDIVIKCMDNLHVNNHKEVVLVGDTHHDAIGASNVGIDFIGVTYGFGFKTKDELNTYAHIDCLNSIYEMSNKSYF